MRWTAHKSTKRSETQVNARKVAMDAFLEGKMEEGKTILKVERTTLSKPEAKTVAKKLAGEGRMDDATTVLLMAMGADQAKRELSPQPTANVGDIVYTRGGYDETHVNFYEVVGTKGQTATIRKIGKRLESTTGPSDYVVPVPGKFVGEPQTKRIQKSGRSSTPYTLAIGDHHTWLWDGTPQRQTASGFGR